MLKYVSALISLFLLFTSIARSQSTDLPSAPNGFSWKRIEKIKGAFLIPNGWHFKEEAKGNTLAYFFAEEDIDKKGQFETGLTVNVLRNLQSVVASEQAEEIISSMIRENQRIESWGMKLGTFKGYGCRVRNTTRQDRIPTIIHALAIGNTKTNTLYILIFESTESKWKAAWEKGKFIMEGFALDDET